MNEEQIFEWIINYMKNKQDNLKLFLEARKALRVSLSKEERDILDDIDFTEQVEPIFTELEEKMETVKEFVAANPDMNGVEALEELISA